MALGLVISACSNTESELLEAREQAKQDSMQRISDSLDHVLNSIDSLLLAMPPDDVMNNIRAMAEEQYPGDYAMQEYYITEQVRAYNRLHPGR